MGVRGLASAIAATFASAVLLAGCGDAGDTGTQTGSNTLTVYSSLPLQGGSRADSLSIINGEKLALEQAGGRIGKFVVKYVSLDDSSASKQGWDPGVAITNARTAVQDKSTIAYLGDFDSGASAISIPLLNSASILQISPSNSAVGLTQLVGGDKGEPEKYYPSSRRTYGRVVPADQVQAAAQVKLQKALGCKKSYLLSDGHIDGEAITRSIAAKAATEGLSVTGGEEVSIGRPTYSEQAAKIRDSGVNCVFVGANDTLTAATLFKDLHTAMPAAKLFGSAGLATEDFAAALDTDAAAVSYITSPALDRKLYPPAGRRFFKQYVAKYAEQPMPYAIYGYEAMRAALASIRAAGKHGNDRLAVTKAFFRIKDRRSPLGTYSIDKDGDTSLRQYGVYRVVHGALSFDRDFRSA